MFGGRQLAGGGDRFGPELRLWGIEMKDFLHDNGVATAAPYTHGFDGSRATFEQVLPAPVIRNTSFCNRCYRDVGKVVFDALLVLIALPLVAPLVLLCAIALWFDGGSPFYRQERLGRKGNVFTIWKLRTMVHDADERLEECLARDPEMRREWETTQKLKQDPRITTIGRVLRKTSLDELPQIWNVLKGEMSLVGPRPMMPDQLPMYGEADAYFAMRPGITGVWQVSARNEETFAYRAKADAVYFKNVSLKCDLELLFKTVGVVVRQTGY